MSRSFGEMACIDCGQITPRRSANQKRCPECRSAHERACSTKYLAERRSHGMEADSYVERVVEIILSRCDLLFENQARFALNIQKRLGQARSEGVTYHLSESQVMWLEGLRRKVTERIAFEEEVRGRQEMARLAQAPPSIH